MKIWEAAETLADYYGRPFNTIPVSEQVYLAETIIREKELEAEIWADEQGIEAFAEIAKTLRDGDDLLAAHKLRAFLISQSGAKAAYEKAMEEMRNELNETLVDIARGIE